MFLLIEDYTTNQQDHNYKENKLIKIQNINPGLLKYIKLGGGFHITWRNERNGLKLYLGMGINRVKNQIKRKMIVGTIIIQKYNSNHRTTPFSHINRTENVDRISWEKRTTNTDGEEPHENECKTTDPKIPNKLVCFQLIRHELKNQK